MNNDSINLLKECDAGCKNATNSMEQVLGFIQDSKLKDVINVYNKQHIEIVS